MWKRELHVTRFQRRDYKNLKALVKKLDSYTCRICREREGFNGVVLHVHHLMYERKKGKELLCDLLTVCTKCFWDITKRQKGKMTGDKKKDREILDEALRGFCKDHQIDFNELIRWVNYGRYEHILAPWWKRKFDLFGWELHQVQLVFAHFRIEAKKQAKKEKDERRNTTFTRHATRRPNGKTFRCVDDRAAGRKNGIAGVRSPGIFYG